MATRKRKPSPRKTLSLRRRIPLPVLLLAIILPASLATVYGLVTQVNTNVQTFTNIDGQEIIVTGGLNVIQFNFTLASENTTLDCAACSGNIAHPAIFSPATFVPNDGILISFSARAGTNLTAGDWLVRYVIATTGTTPANKLFKVTLASNQSPTCGSFNTVCLFPTYYLKTPLGPVTNLFTIVFFDLGPVFAPLPTAFLLKISPA